LKTTTIYKKTVTMQHHKTNNPYGRPKGVPNRTTKEFKELIVKFSNDNYNQFTEDFKLLEPQQRVKYYLDLLKYCLPTAKEIDLKQTEMPFSIANIQISDKDIEDLKEKLKDI
jgi:hypothetical protein